MSQYECIITDVLFKFSRSNGPEYLTVPMNHILTIKKILAKYFITEIEEKISLIIAGKVPYDFFLYMYPYLDCFAEISLKAPIIVNSLVSWKAEGKDDILVFGTMETLYK